MGTGQGVFSSSGGSSGCAAGVAVCVAALFAGVAVGQEVPLEEPSPPEELFTVHPPVGAAEEPAEEPAEPPRPPEPSEPSRYESLLREIDQAGEAGRRRALGRRLDEVDEKLREQESNETRACWQLLKGILMVELDLNARAEALFRSLAGTCPVWQALNNLAVLEAVRGDFAPANDNLCRAVERAGPGEWKVPLDNLAALTTARERPLLVLAGVAAECREGPVATAACGAPDRAAECGLVVPSPVVATAPAERFAPPARGPIGRSEEELVERAVEEARVTVESEIEGISDEDEEGDAERIREMIRRRIQNLPRGLQDAGPGAGSSEPSGVELPEEAEVERAIEAWRDAWKARDSDRYLGSYVAGYTPGASESHEAWRSQRSERLRRKTGEISIGLAMLRVTPEDEGRLAAEFEQTYRDDAFCDRVHKRLVLLREEGAWKIRSESSVTLLDHPQMRQLGLCP